MRPFYQCNFDREICIIILSLLTHPSIHTTTKTRVAKCALASGHAGEAGQIVAMLRKQHEAEIKTIPEVASAVSFLETALKAPREEGEERVGGPAALETLRKLEEKVKVRVWVWELKGCVREMVFGCVYVWMARSMLCRLVFQA